MTSYSPLTTGEDALVAAATSVLVGAGYPFSTSTTSLSSYLASALTGIGGSTVSDKSLSISQMLAAIINASGLGPISNLNVSIEQMLATIAGGLSGSSQLQSDSGTAILSDSDTPILVK